MRKKGVGGLGLVVVVPFSPMVDRLGWSWYNIISHNATEGAGSHLYIVVSSLNTIMYEKGNNGLIFQRLMSISLHTVCHRK